MFHFDEGCSSVVTLLHLSAVSVLTDLVTSMHSLRDKHNIKSHCPCTNKQNVLTKLPATNGVSQVQGTVCHHLYIIIFQMA